LAGGDTLDAAQVWSTAPLPALARTVSPAPPPEALAAAGRLRHRAMILLYVVLDRPRWTEFDAHYFPGPEVVAARVSEPRNYRDDPAQPDIRNRARILQEAITVAASNTDLAAASQPAVGRQPARCAGGGERRCRVYQSTPRPRHLAALGSGRPGPEAGHVRRRVCSPPLTPTTVAWPGAAGAWARTAGSTNLVA
jgi:hypothetical protein